MRFVRSIVALLLLAAWPVLTSHSFLEQLGLIHEAHAGDHHGHHHHSDGESHEHGSADHDFADGGYLAKTSQHSMQLRAALPAQAANWVVAALDSAEIKASASFGPAPPGVAPPEFVQSWNFLLRTAIEARAPSFLS